MNCPRRRPGRNRERESKARILPKENQRKRKDKKEKEIDKKDEKDEREKKGSLLEKEEILYKKNHCPAQDSTPSSSKFLEISMKF